MHFRIYKVDDTFAGNHTIVISTLNKRTYIRQSLNRILTIVTYKALALCDNASNNTEVMVSLGQSVSIEICIRDSLNNLKSVAINGRIIDTGDTSVHSRRKLSIKQNSTELYYLEVTIVNITKESPFGYNVKISSVLNDVLSYSFKLLLTDSLRFCEYEKNVTTIQTHLYEPVIIHICYITSFGALQYCGIDSKVYRINAAEDREDLYVSVEQLNDSTKYFMQIYFRNVTHQIRSRVLLKTSPSQSLSYDIQVSFKEPNYQIKSCKGHKIKIYYYIHFQTNISVCALIATVAKNKTCLQSISYTKHGITTPFNEEFNNVDISVNGSFVFIDIINVNKNNFGRYDIHITMCDKTIIDYTFYLLHDTLGLPSSICNGDTTNFNFEASRDSLLTICFRTFGHLDRTIYINNYSVPIVSNFKDPQEYRAVSELKLKNISVFNIWNQQLETRYILIHLVATENQEMRIEFDSSNTVLVYNI
ncbi:uncharacterized protein LOC106053177 isoform X3 [Biomphalaria glabrata]|nr:uncharacterized protein LOC106053177 isoform X3 [Biomphalaria glabrata]